MDKVTRLKRGKYGSEVPRQETTPTVIPRQVEVAWNKRKQGGGMEWIDQFRKYLSLLIK